MTSRRELYPEMFASCTRRGAQMSRKFRRGSPVALALVITSQTLVGFTVETLDLASLSHASELVVLVSDFRPGAINQTGSGTVKKIYKGEHEIGARIQIVPWGIDFSGLRDVDDAKLDDPVLAIFFLVRMPGSRVWETVVSGARIVVTDDVYALTPRGIDRFAMTLAKSESDDTNRRYRLATFQSDLGAALDRSVELEHLLARGVDETNMKEFTQRLDDEISRAFRNATTSTYVARMAEALARERRERELWEMRGAVRASSLARHVDVLFAEIVSTEFLISRLHPSAERQVIKSALQFVIDSAFLLTEETKRNLTQTLTADASMFDAVTKPLVYEALAKLLTSTSRRPHADTLDELFELATKAPQASFHLHPVLSDRFPRVTASRLPASPPLHVLIRVSSATRSRVAGTAVVRRIASAHEVAPPTLVLNRVGANGKTVGQRRKPLRIPPGALVSGGRGEFVQDFSAVFTQDLLAPGDWRIYVELLASDRDRNEIAWQTPETRVWISW